MDSLKTIEYIGSLHNHTDYSNLYLRDSINTIEGLIDTAIALGHKVIAITEHETVSNAIKIEKYYNKIKEKHPGFKVIRGNEIYLCRDGLTKDNFIKGQDKFYHFILLALDAIGHEQIRELSTRAWMRSWKTGKMARRPTYYQDLIDIIGANPGHVVGSSACFLKGQKVRTKKGEKNIEDIVSTDEILTKEGKWEKINFPTHREYHGMGNILEFTKEPLPIKCTENHQFLVYDDKKKTMNWVPANNLKKNDKCLEPLLPITYSNNNIIDVANMSSIASYRKKSCGQNYRKDIYRVKDKIVITNELMRLFGLWLADGHISKHEEYSRHEIGFTFSAEEFEVFYNSFVMQGLRDLGLEKSDYSIRRREEKHRVDLSINKVEICLLFEELFGISHADKKYIPDRLKHISYDLDLELFFGYFIGDGYFRHREGHGGEIVSASISKQLTKDFEELGLSLNLSGSITISKARTDKNQVNHKESYYLTFSNSFLGKNLNKKEHFSHEKLKEIFKKGSDKKGRYVDIIEFNGLKYRIKKVKKNTPFEINEEVYCLNTDSHNFVLNNIIVHNCLGGFLDNKLLQYNENPDPALWNNILNWCLSMQNIFGKGNFLLELQPSKYKEQKIANAGLLKLSEDLDIPYIITTDSHYARPEDAPIHEAFLNAQEGEREVKSFYATTYLMSGNELNEFIEEEVIAKANETIAEIAGRAQDYSLMKPLVIPSLVWNEPTLKTIPDVYFKRIPSLKKFIESSFNGDNVLARAVVEKLESDARLQTQRIYDEVETNLQMTWESSEVNNAHWSAYFLNLQKIIEVCWNSGTLVGCGRGSGVGFILLYLLDIIQINPLWETTKLYPWRFLNPSRVSVLDIDTDIEGGRRAQTLQALRDFYGQDRVSNVVTFRTEKSKSALQTAARGLGIDVDISLYLASLVPVDRGIARTLKQCYYGDEENGFKPVPEFVRQMKLYPELWSVAQRIEGLVCGIGEHAGGVIFVDESFTKSTALMRVPNGDVVTQFDLHDSEDVSLIKIDLLSVEALDKIHTCLDLLVEYKYLEPGATLKETYEKAIGVYNLERDNKDMWKMIWSHKIESLFQMEKQSGIQGIALTKPECLDDLATLNSVIRLMAQEPGDEQPLNKYARFKKDISLWYAEMDRYGLTKEEQTLLEPILRSSYGICESQERFMMLVQLPECGGMSLTWADSLRKSIAKKNPAAYMKLQEEYYKTIEEKGLSQNLCHYVWDVLVATSRGYGFNLSHTLAYSIIGLQEMNLCFRYPIIFWNCACLITDSGAAKENESADYNKIAIAIGKMKKSGIKIIPPDVNKSEAIFAPDVNNNCIYYGFKSLVSVGDDVISQIITNRPFVSVPDFLNRIKLNKTATLSLIKSGAFDSLEPNRMELMGWFIWQTCDKKKRLTLQNMRKLILEDLVPSNLSHERAVFEFNRYLKAVCKFDAENYKLDERALSFIENNYLDLFSIVNYDKILNIKQWDKIYQKEMDGLRDWLKEDGEEVLFKLNEKIFRSDWNKYIKRPNYSSWEMESTCLYFHEHELKNINNSKYGLRDFETLPEEPRVAKSFEKGGRTINMFELSKIIGTVIAKDKNKNIISLLTRGGTVVTIKFPKAYYSIYDKQISVVGEDGKKKVIEKSWFTKGNMLVINGMRRGANDFVAKKYASQGGHTLYRVSEIDDFGNIMITSERAKGIEEEGDE